MTPVLALRVAFALQLQRLSKQLASAAPILTALPSLPDDPPVHVPSTFQYGIGCRCEGCVEKVRAYKKQYYRTHREKWQGRRRRAA